MPSIRTVTLETPEPEAAPDFYARAFGLGSQLDVRSSSDTSSSGFRGYTLSVVVSQPGTVDAYAATALAAGATTIKPPARSMWGYGTVLAAPDGALWTIATSSRKDTGPSTRKIDELVLQLGVEDVAASRRFYIDRGLTVAKSFGRTYVEFDSPGAPVKLALYKRRGLAKAAGVDAQGHGSHRIVIGADLGTFTDPDGFAWAAAA